MSPTVWVVIVFVYRYVPKFAWQIFTDRQTSANEWICFLKAFSYRFFFEILLPPKECEYSLKYLKNAKTITIIHIIKIINILHCCPFKLVVNNFKINFNIFLVSTQKYFYLILLSKYNSGHSLGTCIFIFVENVVCDENNAIINSCISLNGT